MRVLLLVAAALLAAADPGPPPAAPAINPGGIVNAATNQAAPENFVSPGAIISIYGTGLAPVTREVRPGDIDNGFLPEILAGVGVFFGGVAAPLFYVSPLQINAQVPTILQPADWEVRVRWRAWRAASAYWSGPTRRACSPSPATPAEPWRAPPPQPDPAEFILFFGTGFGPTRPPMLSGALAPQALFSASPLRSR